MAAKITHAHSPRVIGACTHCGLPLYAGAPVATPKGQIAHVACDVDARRR